MQTDNSKQATDYSKELLESFGAEQSSCPVNLEKLIERLLGRAPSRYLKRVGQEGLSASVRNILDALSEFSRSSSTVAHKHPEDGTIVVVTADRPFIIASVREALRMLNVRVEAYLHPILELGDSQVSVSLIQTESDSAEELELALRRIQATLQHVELCTEHFSQMSEQLVSTRESFAASCSDKELVQFLDWLEEGNFIFLGTSSWTGKSGSFILDEGNGLFTLEEEYGQKLRAECQEDFAIAAQREQEFLLRRLRRESRVHRRARLVSISLRSKDKVFSILGLFTSGAQAESSLNIPHLRGKVSELLKLEGAVEESYDYKSIVDIIDRMPLSEAVALELPELQALTRSILNVHDRKDTKVTIRIDESGRGASALIIMPRERFNAELRAKIQHHLETAFGAATDSSEYFLDLSNKPHARFYFHLPVAEMHDRKVSLSDLEAQIVALSRSWLDNLEARITLSEELEDPKETWLHYRNAFSPDYKTLQTVEQCERDIVQMQRLSAGTRSVINFVPAAQHAAGTFEIVLYNLGNEVTISSALPILEKSGFEVISETTNKVEPAHTGPCFIQRFLVRPKFENRRDSSFLNERVAPALEEMFRGKGEIDAMSSLIASAGLAPRQINLLRLYVSLLWQVNKLASRGSIMKILQTEEEFSQKLFELFEMRFQPGKFKQLSVRREACSKFYHDLVTEISTIRDITSYRIIRYLAELIQNTARTNYYQDRDVLSVKIFPEAIDFVPSPKPFAEIFVWSNETEGVHLRSSSVARGGLRWSDRIQDFRAEVLGLMKTQRIKNALIVPQGAKGGFIVRSHFMDESRRRECVEQAYKQFIRGIISLADNRIDDKIVRPANTVCFDERDEYLVVAADKGTATFSDLANKIAEEEFSFWMGDAFASGGSYGYDHKKYGITAFGAWQSVLRHFKNIGLNYEEEDFRVVGIGDMSGDVFGNGLLCSDKMKLIAAFNHMHIFIDPNPDSAASFKERKRLFELPRSQWTDYSSELISKGGAVYERSAREIRLSPEARQALSIDENAPEIFSGEELIQQVLLSEAELLWNGGIGTYVKARSESNADVQDSINDTVRVNAEDLRVQIIGEGGNLGLTQRARIAFSRRGGHINTDAIDNSGGVDLSDHEVNIKILLQRVVRAGGLELESRNKLLFQIVDDVVKDVLAHNQSHARLLSVGIRRSRRSIEYFRTLIRELGTRAYIDRRLENLPDDEELAERTRNGEGLVRPELAVCLSGVKMWAKDEFLNSDLPSDPLLEPFLYDYFPSELREKYRTEIAEHPLRREIIATQATNLLIDSVGITFLHRMCITHSARPIDVIKCALAAEAILDLRGASQGVSKLDTFRDNRVFLQIIEELNGAMRDATSWLLSHFGRALSLQDLVSRFQKPYSKLIEKADEIFAADEKQEFTERKFRYEQAGLGNGTPERMALLRGIPEKFEIVNASLLASSEVESTAKLFFSTSEELGLTILLEDASESETNSKWEHELVSSSVRRIRSALSSVCCSLLSKNIPVENVSETLQGVSQYDLLAQTISELEESELKPSAIAVLANRVEDFARGIYEHSGA